MLKKIFLFISILCAIDGYSQRILTGKVVDENKQPLFGAHVLVVELNKGTFTDAHGSFQLRDLPRGKITIRISFLGYANYIEALSFVKDTMSIYVTLRPSPIQSEEIVVSGGYVTSQHANAVKIELMKLYMFQNIQSPSFVETLTKVPGVDMISKGIGITKPVIRGLAMDNILSLNNGARYENYQYSSHHPLGIDEYGVEQVEIIKGPASLMYGSDAIGGVLNFIKEKPALANTWKGDWHSALYSNSLGFENSLGLKKTGKNLFAGVRLSQKNHADYLQGGGDFVPNTRFNENTLKFFLGNTHKYGINKIYYEFAQNKIGLAEDEAIEQISKRQRISEIFYQKFNTHFAQIQNKFFISDFKLALNGAYQNTELIHFGNPHEREIDMQLGTLQYEAKLYLPSSEKTDYVIGYQGMTQQNKNIHDAEVILLPNARTKNHSFFTLIKWTWWNHLTPQLGVRYDLKNIKTDAVGDVNDSLYRKAVNKNYNRMSASVGFTYNPIEDMFLRFNVANAYRTPNLAELTSYGQHELRFEVGNANLKTQTSTEYDISMHVHKENRTFDVAVFYNSINNFIYIQPTGDTASTGIHIYEYRQSDAFLYGGEVGLHFHPKKHNWLHVESSFSMVFGEKKTREYLPMIPAHKWMNEIRFIKNRCSAFNNAFIGLHSTYRFKQNRIADEEIHTPDYWLLDVTIGGTLQLAQQHITIVLGINNLMDKKYIDHLSSLKEVGYFNPGRNIFISLKFLFGNEVKKEDIFSQY